MNAFLYHVASGHAFFTGTGLILAAALLGIASSRRLAQLVSGIACLLGAILIAISGTPLPMAFYAPAGLLVATWLVVDRPSSRRRRLIVAARSATIGACLFGVSRELPCHLVPRVSFPPGSTLFVIGDSISAGMTDGENTWPKRLQHDHVVEVLDFSHVGATAASAMRQADRVQGPGIVLVEIGGNDVLGPNGGTPISEFEQHLDALLTRLASDGRTVVMLELPLPPFANAYGAAQRRLAKAHGIALIPKRVLLGVLTTGGATLDSIHLSSEGHQLLADRITRILGM